MEKYSPLSVGMVNTKGNGNFLEEREKKGKAEKKLFIERLEKS